MDNQVFLRLLKSKAGQHTKRRQAAPFGVLLSAACKHKLGLRSSLGLLNLFGQHVLIQRQTGLYRYEQAAGPTLFDVGVSRHCANCSLLFQLNVIWCLQNVLVSEQCIVNPSILSIKVILSQYEGVRTLYNLPNSIRFLPFYPFWWVSAPNHKIQIWLMTLTLTLRICLTLTNIWRRL